MPGAVTDKDRGYDALFRRLAKQNQGRVVDVGVMGRESSKAYQATQDSAPLTVADVASKNEFGLGVPERSFIRAYVDANRNRIIVDLREMAKRVIDGQIKSFDAGLELIGLKIQREIMERIRSGIEPPNAQVTIDRKGSSVPLIDTGQLINSITYLVRQIAEEA